MQAVVTQQVAKAITEQRKTNELVVNSTININTIVSDNIKAVDQLNKSLDHLVGIAKDLQKSTERFASVSSEVNRNQ